MNENNQHPSLNLVRTSMLPKPSQLLEGNKSGVWVLGGDILPIYKRRMLGKAGS